MSSTMAELLGRLHEVEQQLEAEITKDLEEKAAAFRYRVDSGYVRFEAAARERHRAARTAILAFLRESSLATILTSPVIYAMVVPLALLDLMLVLYQATCFRAYGIQPVKRSKYVVLDRRRLGYLNWIERLNCDYCSYANGVVAFAREVGARTEQYWCPIKHARRVLGTHARYREFLDYGDSEAWTRDLPAQRDAARR